MGWDSAVAVIDDDDNAGSLFPIIKSADARQNLHNIVDKQFYLRIYSFKV